ncbi:MAG: hypothetical protein D6805_01215 [Planctomycetota bacterium]|nr:MAG: hypothetical protein D6805_01215 [Planctomycetota bacterium]
MIQINLLPPEHRKRQKQTPIGVFILIILGTIFVVIMIFGYFLLEQEIANKNSKLKNAKEENAILNSNLKEIQKLEEEIQKAKKRQKTIISIAKSKIFWSTKLYEFASIIREGNHNVWLESLEVDEKKFKAKCWSKGLSEANVARFRRDILNHRSFFSIFEKMEDYKDLKPKEIQYDPADEEEKENLTFTLVLKLKPKPKTPQTTKKKK